MSFGINAALGIFQHVISQLLTDIPGALNISDEIIVFGQTQQKHNGTLDRVLKKISDNNLTLNAENCEFNKKSLEFFGFIFSDGGMKSDPKKAEDIRNLAPPTNLWSYEGARKHSGYNRILVSIHSRLCNHYCTFERTHTQE